MSIRLALHDAATNCARDGAKATVTLRSGVQISGGVNKPLPSADTVQMDTGIGGWTTVVIDEICAVSVSR